MTINWKLISYLMAFLAGVEWGRERGFLSLVLAAVGLVSYWYIKNGHLSCEHEDDTACGLDMNDPAIGNHP